MTSVVELVDPPPADLADSSPIERLICSKACVTLKMPCSFWQWVCCREASRRVSAHMGARYGCIHHVYEVRPHSMPARAHSLRRHHLTAADVYETCLLRPFQASVRASDVETSAPRDRDPSYLSIRHPRRRGTGRRRPKGAFRARANPLSH